MVFKIRGAYFNCKPLLNFMNADRAELKNIRIFRVLTIACDYGIVVSDALCVTEIYTIITIDEWNIFWFNVVGISCACLVRIIKITCCIIL